MKALIVRCLERFISWLRVSDIRQRNRSEREQYGDGSHAPHWPHDKWNGHFTMHRGVWVDDAVAVPANAVLDAVRKAHWDTYEIVSYTLVEGEQEAPMGKDGAWIRVKATGHSDHNYISDARGQIKEYIPSVSVSPVHRESDEDYWGTSFMGTLPCTMTRLALRRKPTIDLERPLVKP